MLAITGCSGSGGDKSPPAATATTISGTAATGAALSGTVTAVGANGKTVTVALAANGTFTLTSTDLTFPALVKADNGAGTVLYSWAASADVTANITPFTTLALILVTDLSDNLDAVFNGWLGSASALTPAAAQIAQAKVNANLQAFFGGAALDYTNYDFLTTTFAANGSGIDAVLDALDFSFTYSGSDFAGVVSLMVAGTSTAISIDPAIDISAISIGGAGGGSGGGGTTLACDTSLFLPNTPLHVPTSDEWATTYAKTYTVDEGTFGMSGFTKTGSGTLVLGAYGSVTYNGTLYALTSACVVTDITHGVFMLMSFGTIPIDIFSDGSVSGISPADGMTGIQSPVSGTADGTSVTLTPIVNGIDLIPEYKIAFLPNGIAMTGVWTDAISGNMIFTVEYISSNGLLSVSVYSSSPSVINLGLNVVGSGIGTCDLTGLNTARTACASLGVVFDKTTGLVSFTNTPMKNLSGSTDNYTFNGSLSFIPF